MARFTRSFTKKKKEKYVQCISCKHGIRLSENKCQCVKCDEVYHASCQGWGPREYNRRMKTGAKSEAGLPLLEACKGCRCRVRAKSVQDVSMSPSSFYSRRSTAAQINTSQPLRSRINLRGAQPPTSVAATSRTPRTAGQSPTSVAVTSRAPRRAAQPPNSVAATSRAPRRAAHLNTSQPLLTRITQCEAVRAPPAARPPVHSAALARASSRPPVRPPQRKTRLTDRRRQRLHGNSSVGDIPSFDGREPVASSTMIYSIVEELEGRYAASQASFGDDGQGTVELEMDRSFVEVVEEGVSHLPPPSPPPPPPARRPYERPHQSMHDETNLAEYYGRRSINNESTHEENDQPQPEPEPVWKIIPLSSKRATPVISDGRGFDFGKHKHNTGDGGWNRWRCTKRTEENKCKAYLKQRGSNEDWLTSMDITPFGLPHTHPPEIGSERNRVENQMNREAADLPGNMHVPSGVIIDATEKKLGLIREPMQKKRKVKNKKNSLNKYRARNRYPDPKPNELLTFFLLLKYVGNCCLAPMNDFLQSDIIHDGQRHLIFATKTMLYHLHHAKKWYVDGTFKLVKRPFYQLFSIHGFVKQGRYKKQIPLCFVLMSRRQTEDYRVVLEEINELAVANHPTQAPIRLRGVVVDFEMAVWTAMKDVFGRLLKIQGCLFHWVQCIYRRICKEGYKHAYTHDMHFHDWCRDLMALPYLPHEFIKDEFQKIAGYASSSGARRLVKYIKDNWIDAKVWCPRAWSVFMLETRTNNDVEGWHNGVNAQNHRAMGMYALIRLLYSEAEKVPINVQQVYLGLLTRNTRAKYRHVQRSLKKAWDSFNDQRINESELLHECAHLHDAVQPNPLALNQYDSDDDREYERILARDENRE